MLQRAFMDVSIFDFFVERWLSGSIVILEALFLPRLRQFLFHVNIYVT
jgi:hypothetical protein